MKATHQIINVVTGVRPLGLHFASEGAAKTWLASYGVSESYKQEHYRIVPITSQPEEGDTEEHCEDCCRAISMCICDEPTFRDDTDSLEDRGFSLGSYAH